MHATCRYVLRTRTVARDDLAERAFALLRRLLEETTVSRERAPRGRAAHACDGGAIAVRLASSRPAEGHDPPAPPPPREGSGVPSRRRRWSGAATCCCRGGTPVTVRREEDTGPIQRIPRLGDAREARTLVCYHDKLAGACNGEERNWILII
jgi:hypothetical protein